jgi:hypothetical protein
MKTLCIFALSVLTCAFANAQLIVNHSCATLGDIPASAITQAKANLHIMYGHTSHGSQLVTGMSGLIGQTNLIGYQGDIYQFNSGGSDGALDLTDGSFGSANDLGNPDFTTWASETRAYLNEHSSINVVIWSWCGQLSWASTENVDQYLSLMSGLESDFPNVHFVYMTGHHDIGNDATIKTNNARIRAYCIQNGKTLYDFFDIESYGPDGTYYEFADDACNYYSDATGGTQLGNWGAEWQNSKTEGVYWYTCDSAHSEAVNANKKTYAAWWLWARLAGWSGPGAESMTFTKQPVGGWFQEGMPLNLSVDVEGTSGDVSYQWIKDGQDLPGETDYELTRDSLAVADSGWYCCRVNDEAKSTALSKSVHIEVFAAGSLPALSHVGLVATFALCCAGGFLAIRRSRNAA